MADIVTGGSVVGRALDGGADRRSARSMPAERRAALALATLLSVYALSILVVGISGDFPLDDDWAFATTTREFVGTGVFTPSSWISLPLLFEVLFAAPFCMATHCGSDDLRVATLLASVLLFSGTFLLVRSVTRSTTLCLLAAALLAFNPIAYALSFTFMSDVIFAAVMAIGALLFIRSLERDDALQAGLLAALGTAAALAATLTRQLGLCLPLAYLAVRVVQVIGTRGRRPRALAAVLPLSASSLPLLACGGALALLRQWLRLAGRLPASYDAKSDDLVDTLHSPVSALLRVGHNASVTVLYLGLFTLPLLLTARGVARGAPDSHSGRIPTVAAGAAATLAAADLLSLRRLMPSGGNILTPQGIGPFLLRDVGILGLPDIPPLPTPFWVIVTLLALAGAFGLVERVTAGMLDLAARSRRGGLRTSDVAALFAGTAALAYLAPVMLIPFYDRYLIPVLPLALLLVASCSAGPDAGRWRAAAASALCLLTSAYAVLGAHDAMAWNRARWRALADLEARGVGPDRIDGGMEYNGLRAYRPDYVPKPGKSWWWIDGDDYQIAFGPMDGLRVAATYPYRTLLPPADRSIKVLTRAP